MNHSWIRLVAVSLFLLVVFPIQSGAWKWKPISEEDSLLTVKIGDLTTRYRGTGWNENYSLQGFRATVKATRVKDSSIVDRQLYTVLEYPLKLMVVMWELAKDMYWGRKKRDLIQSIERRYGPLTVLDHYNTGDKHAEDSRHRKGASVKFRRTYSKPPICYSFSYSAGFGDAWDGCSDWCPALVLHICASRDLNLDMTEPSKYFRIDTDNEKASLNLSHSNLGQKLNDLLQ